MADYFTHFSCLLDLGTPESAARALDLYANTPEDEDGLRLSDGFDLSIQTEGGSELWIHVDCSGDPERVIEFVLFCAEEFDLKGLLGLRIRQHLLEAAPGCLRRRRACDRPRRAQERRLDQHERMAVPRLGRR